MNERVKALVEAVRNHEIIFPVGAPRQPIHLTTGPRLHASMIDEYHIHFKRNRPSNSNDGLFIPIIGIDLAKGEDQSVEVWKKANPALMKG